MKDHSLWVLAAGLMFFTLVVIGVAAWMPGNQAIYALFAGILGNFSGGLMVYLRIQPAAGQPDPPVAPPAGPPGEKQ